MNTTLLYIVVVLVAVVVALAVVLVALAVVFFFLALRTYHTVRPVWETNTAVFSRSCQSPYVAIVIVVLNTTHFHHTYT